MQRRVTEPYGVANMAPATGDATLAALRTEQRRLKVAKQQSLERVLELQSQLSAFQVPPRNVPVTGFCRACVVPQAKSTLLRPPPSVLASCTRGRCLCGSRTAQCGLP